MKRLFRVKEWHHTADSEGYVTRTLEIGDNIRIGKITYRIMEDPYNGLLQCLPHDPELCQDEYREFHEDDVDEIIWTEYEEY